MGPGSGILPPAEEQLTGLGRAESCHQQPGELKRLRLPQNLSNKRSIQNQFCVWVILSAFLSFLMPGRPLTEEMQLPTPIQQAPLAGDPGQSQAGEQHTAEDMQISPAI